MSSMKVNPLVSPSGGPRGGRAALAISQAIFDSHVRPQAVPFGSRQPRGGRAVDYFEKLLQQEGCQAAWDAYTKTATFPKDIASGELSLNGFRHYTLQDAIYLEYYVRVNMKAIGSWDAHVSTDELRTFVLSQPSTLEYSQSMRTSCTDQLGIPKADVDDEWDNGRSSQLETSIRTYENVIVNAVQNKGNSWLDIHIALLPCIKGYYVIGEALMQSTTTVRNTLYYPMWIEPNTDRSTVDRYDEFLQANTEGASDAQWVKWGEIFRQGCVNELAFFYLALENFPAYNIVTAADSYTIRPFVYSGEFLGVDGNNAIISATSTQWKLINSVNGYAIQLNDTSNYLGYDGQKVVMKTDDSTKWFINTVPLLGTNTFQLFLDGAMQSALEVDSNKEVSVGKIDLTIQIWILTSA